MAITSFFLLGLHLLHMEVPRPGVELEMDLQPLAYATATAIQIQATSVTHAAAEAMLDP